MVGASRTIPTIHVKDPFTVGSRRSIGLQTLDRLSRPSVKYLWFKTSYVKMASVTNLGLDGRCIYG